MSDALDGTHRSCDPGLRWSRRDSLAVALLTLLPFALFARLYLPGIGRRWFPSGDFVDQFYAFASYETARFAAGKLPLWNPFAYAGSPFWADVQAAVAYPPSLAVTLGSALIRGELPFLALELESVAHLSLAAVLTYAFARRLLGCRFGGLVAALSFGCSGYLLGYPMLQLAVLESNAWLPLALLGVYRVFAGEAIARVASGDRADPAQLRKAGSWRRWRVWLPDPALALAIGMAILAGHPQSAMYLLYATAGYAVWRLWRDRPAWTRLPSLATSFLLGAGISAAGWWPALEFLGLSNRIEANYAMLSNGFPPQELLGLLLPGLTLWSPLYLGILPLGLAIAAVLAWGRRGGQDVDAQTPDEGLRDLPFWLTLVWVALLVSLGRHGFLFDLYYLFAPGFDLFRGQERSALLVAFGLAMLAGAGARLWWLGLATVSRDLTLMAAGLSSAGALLAVAAASDLRAPALHLVFASGAIALLVLAQAWIERGRLHRSVWLALVVSVIVGDLFLALGRVNLAEVAPSELRPDAMIGMLQQSQPQRVDNEDRLPRNFGVLHGIEASSGASPLWLRGFGRLRDALQMDHPTRWRDLMAVSHVLSWREALEVPGERLLGTGEGEAASHLHQLDWVAPYAWRAMRAERVPDEAEALALVSDPDFSLLSRVILHDGEGGGDADPAASLSQRARRPGYSRVLTEGESAGWVVFSEMHYPGWLAYVDGEPAELLRADLALIAVPVPAGEHVVEIRFTAPRVRQGISISLISLLLLALTWTATLKSASAA